MFGQSDDRVRESLAEGLLRDTLSGVHSSPDAETIAATLRVANDNEELRPRPAGLALDILDGPDAGRYEIAGEAVTVGRGSLCDVTLRDASVSEFHFKLVVGTEDVLLEDLGSSNGVWIDRARVSRAHLLVGAKFRAGAVRMQLRDIATAPRAVARHEDFHGLRARSEAMRAIFSTLSRVAPKKLAVLLTGETGVGKGQAARALHRASGRPGKLVTVDCTALPYGMADGLLFGHVKGSFTGATSDRASPFEEAEGGTIFLDEIGELPLDLQPKLLRTIDEGVVRRLGSNRDVAVDVRIVAATNRDLTRLISAGRFRADVYHRVAGFEIQLPPLRARRADIRFLAEMFLAEVCAEMGEAKVLGEAAAKVLEEREWPGNVRELRQTIRRSAYVGEGVELEIVDGVGVVEELEGGDGGAEVVDAAGKRGAAELGPVKPLVDDFTRDYCRALLAQSRTMAAAAGTAGVTVRGLQLMLKRLGLRAQDLLGRDG